MQRKNGRGPRPIGRNKKGKIFIYRGRGKCREFFLPVQRGGAKIFRYVLEYLDEDISSLPMRDILNRLERYHFIDSANEWNYIRELRNSIAHDYPLWENDIVDSLNALVAKVPVLQGIYEKLKTVVYN